MHTPLAQGGAHQVGLGTGADQDRDVPRSQPFESTVGLPKPVLGVVEPNHHLLGTVLGVTLPNLALPPQRGVVGPQQRRLLATSPHPPFQTTLGQHRHIRQRVVPFRTEHKSPLWGLRLGLCKQVVESPHHRPSGAVVGAQHVVAPLGVPFRTEVAVDVRTPKGVNGLFGIADQQQQLARAVVLHPVDRVQNGVLDR